MMDKGLFTFFETAERINRGAAYFGGKSKALSMGKTEEQAIEYAKEIVRKTQFLFDVVDTPIGLSSDIMKTLFQMQTFTVKQTEFLAEMAMNKDIMGLARYSIAGLAFVYTIGKAFGMEPKDLIPTFRFGVPPSMKLPWEAGKAAFNAPDKYGNERDLKTKATDVAESAIGLIPGGIQAKKTIQGAQAVKVGGSYDKGDKLQFKVGQTTPQKAQALLFGKYAGSGAKDYFNQDVDLVREEAVKLDKELSGLPPDEAGRRYVELKTTNPQLYAKLTKVIEERVLGLTEDDKKMRGLGVVNGDRARYVDQQIMKLPEGQRAVRYEELKKKKIITKQVAEQLMEMHK